MAHAAIGEMTQKLQEFQEWSDMAGKQMVVMKEQVAASDSAHKEMTTEWEKREELTRKLHEFQSWSQQVQATMAKLEAITQEKEEDIVRLRERCQELEAAPTSEMAMQAEARASAAEDVAVSLRKDLEEAGAQQLEAECRAKGAMELAEALQDDIKLAARSDAEAKVKEAKDGMAKMEQDLVALQNTHAKLQESTTREERLLLREEEL